MYATVLATSTGQFIQAQVSEPRVVTRMAELSDRVLSAVEALTDSLPANLPNRYKRLAGHLVKRVMHARGYALAPGRRSGVLVPLYSKQGLW